MHALKLASGHNFTQLDSLALGNKVLRITQLISLQLIKINEKKIF